jgi:WD40 repeat protein
MVATVGRHHLFRVYEEGLMHPDAQLAESVYQELNASMQDEARKIILRLIRLDDALQPHWRTSSKRELDELEPGHETALRTLQEAGLVAVSQEDDPRNEIVATGSGELLETWPRLRGWITENRSGLLIRQQTAAAAAAWQAAGRRERDLWDQPRMTVAAAISDIHGDVGPLDRLSREFLNASEDRTRRKPRDLPLRHPRALTAAACALLIVIAGVIWGAAGSSSGNSAVRNTTRSQQLITDAEEESASNPVIAEQLALAAYRYSPSQAATALLYKIFSQPSDNPVADTGSGILRISAASGAPLVAVSSGNGKTGSFRLWAFSSRASPVLDATVSHVPSAALALSPDGASLAAACNPGLCLWSVTSPRHPVAEAVLRKKRSGSAASGGITSMAFSSDGDLLAAASEAGKTYVWSVRDPRRPSLITTLPNPMTTDDPLAGVAFSGQDKLLAETIQGGQTRLWSLRDASRPALVATIGTGYQSVQFSPDGTMLAAAGGTRVALWHLTDPAHPRLVSIQNGCTTGSTGSALDLHAIAFSPDGDQIAYSGQDTTDSDATMCVLNLSASNLASGKPTAASIPTNFASLALAYTAGGILLSGGQDGVLRQWQAPLQQIDGLVPATHGASFDVSQDGRLLAGILEGPLAGDTYQPAGVGLWDVSTPSGPVIDSTIPVLAESVTFLTPDTLLIATQSGQIQLWDVGDPGAPRKGASLGDAVIPDNSGWSFSGEVTSTSTGTLVSVLGADGSLHLWRVSSAFRVRQLSVMPTDGAEKGPAGILPDGRTAMLVTGAGIQWISLADPSRPVLGSFTHLPNANVGEGSSATARGLFLAGSPAGNGNSATYDLVGLDDGTVTSSVILTRSASDAMAISADGTITVVGGDGNRNLTIWATADPGHPRRLAAISIPRSDFIALNSSHTLLAVDGSAMSSASVQIWSLRDPGTPVLTGTFAPPPEDGDVVLNEQEFSPSGLLFLQNLSTVYLISTSSTDLTGQLCSSLRTPITSAQWQQYAPGVPYLNPCPASRG